MTALCSLWGFSGAFRRSELVALTVADLQEAPDGFRMLIRHSKTDQEGAGQEIAIPRGARLRVVEAVTAWMTDAGITEGPVFRQVAKGGRVLAEALIVVHHLPPGTSKWNKIEHRLFSFITMNWKAEPLASYRVIVDLIAATTTKTGLTVRCELDSTYYPKGIVVSDKEMDDFTITRDPFHGEWNYTIHPTDTNAPSIKAINFG